MDFGLVPGDTSCALTSCHVVISKQWVAVRRGRPVEQVCNRKETTWYENHTFRFRQSVQSESRVEPGICSRSRASRTSRTIRLTWWCKRCHSLAPGRRYGARRSPLSEYMSLHLSLKLTTNWVSLSRIKWERYIFIKKCVRSLFEVRSLSSIMFLVGSMRSIQHYGIPIIVVIFKAKSYFDIYQMI